MYTDNTIELKSTSNGGSIIGDSNKFFTVRSKVNATEVDIVDDFLKECNVISQEYAGENTYHVHFKHSKPFTVAVSAVIGSCDVTVLERAEQEIVNSICKFILSVPTGT